MVCFFFQAEDGIRYLVRSRGLGDVYKRQPLFRIQHLLKHFQFAMVRHILFLMEQQQLLLEHICLLYTSDAADERSSVDLGGRRIIKKKKSCINGGRRTTYIIKIQQSLTTVRERVLYMK